MQTGREVAKFGFRLWRGVLSDKLFLTVYLVVGSIILLGWIGLGLVKTSLLQLGIVIACHRIQAVASEPTVPVVAPTRPRHDRKRGVH